MIYGLVISAGKQSRFNSEIPKALMPYKGKPLLDYNIEHLKHYCNLVYVVCSHENAHWFSSYDRLIIDSGYGCGDAVVRALKLLPPFDSTDMVFIQWGDCLVDSEVYKKCYEISPSSWIIPCQLETNPYVSVESNKPFVKVLFSKYGEKVDKGFHDLSVFYGPAQLLLESAQQYIKIHPFLEDHYDYPEHGNEFQFLDLFNETLLKADILDLSYLCLKTFSFNTLNEYNKLVDDQ